MSWILSLLLNATVAHGHAGFVANTQVVPRSADTGLKTAPCGGILRTSSPTQLEPGATITVNWQETINHPGRFEFYFSQAGETNWQLLKTVQDTLDDNAVPHNYSTTITLPNVQCTDCTLQMIQVMTENPALPSYYYSCADIRMGTQSVPSPPPGNNCTP